jgi:malonyl CoA-acyl carrier protein transacylase
MYAIGLVAFDQLDSAPRARHVLMAGFVMAVRSFEDGLKLVKLRGESMQAAADAVPSAMVSVIGLDADRVTRQTIHRQNCSSLVELRSYLGT